MLIIVFSRIFTDLCINCLVNCDKKSFFSPLRLVKVLKIIKVYKKFKIIC